MATMTAKDFATATPSWWCPGCGDFGVLSALKAALAELGKQPHQVAFISGIGCSGKISGYVHSYAFHGVHGRALPVATAVKLANRDLTVIAAGGDGDGYAIGAGHFVHAVRRNADITYIVMDNQTYGLTKGQASPTSATGYVASVSPDGNPDSPINGLALALAAGASFLARGFSAQPKHLVQMIKMAIEHKGFSIVEVMSPCVTYNKINTYAWFKEHLSDVSNSEGYAPDDRSAAFNALTREGSIPMGLIYQEHRPTLEDRTGLPALPIAHLDLEASRGQYAAMLAHYR
ncbi:MAG: Pyruvate synthase subunit porB [Candidatus Eremiobacteraeota bacterium]|jgi:2-oxoglutarate ferredoxin oxidoreductase subunit beta|nr:Pyruvate synthase subunit porB [Candidatus Eremiobacteraeota bacterium]